MITGKEVFEDYTPTEVSEDFLDQFELLWQRNVTTQVVNKTVMQCDHSRLQIEQRAIVEKVAWRFVLFVTGCELVIPHQPAA